MKVQHHAVFSLAFAALLGFWLRSAAAGLACFLGGVLVDGDHAMDYLWNRPGSFRPRRFFETFEKELLDRIFVLLHSWEIIAAGALALAVLPAARRPAALGLLAGMAAHLALDNAFNRHSRWAYFLLFRLRHGFAGRHFYGPREYHARRRHMRRMAPRGGTP